MFRSICLLLILVSVPSVSSQSTFASEKIVLVGDSTVATKSGWGDSFGSMLRADVQWVNLAKGGRSSKSYRDEGWWDKALAEQPTWVFIQFGHNDQPGKGSKRETDPQTSFQENLSRYVQQAREIGAKPVLVTSLTRRKFDDQGRIRPRNLEEYGKPEGYHLSDFANATKAVAQKLHVPVIDLFALSVEQMNRFGMEAAKQFDPKPKDPAVPDVTHLNAYGAKTTATLIRSEVCRVLPEFTPLLKAKVFHRFHFTDQAQAPLSTSVSTETTYSPETGYGFLPQTFSQKTQASVFAVNIPEGNYAITMQFGHPTRATSTTIKAEARRLMIEQVETQPGETVTKQFVVNVRQPEIEQGVKTKLNGREWGPPVHPSWDNVLTFEMNGSHPGVQSIEIRPAANVTTVYIAGDSTVTDQRNEPYAGWGQMLPGFFGPDVVISNQAESGLTLRSFEYQLRLKKVLHHLQPGDYLLIQFGHNDQKDKREGAGPYTTYKQKLVEFVEAVRAKHGIPILVTSMERLRMDSKGNQTPTLSDFAEAVRQVGNEQQVPVIDLNTMSLQFYKALGPKRATKAFAFYPANSFPGQTKALKDQTHHNSYGAYELARCIVKGIRSNVPELATHLKPELESFDPSQPLDPLQFTLPASPVVEPPQKPAGN